MAVISTWVQNSIAGSANVNTGLPSLLVDVPANRTLKRVVIYGTASGTQHGNGNVDTFSPITFGYNVTLGFPTTGLKTICTRQVRVPFSAVGVDDHNLLTSNRVYTLFHGLGDQDMGANLQMSWGGPVSPAMRLIMGGLFSFNVTTPAQTAFKMYYSFVLKALYQRTV
jgi:hypothetical protein